ncbi:MAG: NADH-quinone oxidoreductase subunit J [Nitrospiraceae bacterium]|nr:NADH-quinone oxidoreductase subunit J [Nitrospiraceae bacterium]
MNTPFVIASVVAVVSTLMVITRTNVVHALLYLIVSLLSVSLVFFLLGAPFIAALEIIIYAGAIMVLFVFVVMMLNLGPQSKTQERMWLIPEVWTGPAVLAVILLGELVYIFASTGGITTSGKTVPAGDVGFALFGPYLLGVELASMLLLAGIVGAYHLGRRGNDDEQKEER